MVTGTVDVNEALEHLVRVFEEVNETEWSVEYAKNISKDFGAKISESDDIKGLESFAESVTLSTNEVNAAITQILEIESILPKILNHYISLSAIGDAWMLSIGQEILNRRHTMSYYQ